MKQSTKILIGAVALLTVGYGVVSAHYNNRFLPNTTIAGVSVGGKTTAQAASLLKTNLATEKYTVVDQNNRILSFNSRSVGVHAPTKAALDTVQASQSALSWPLHLSAANASDHGVQAGLINQSKLKRVAQKLVTKANQTPRTATKNARLTYQNGRFTIAKPVYGTQVSLASATSALKAALKTDTQTIALSSAYVKPTLTTKSPSLQQAKKTATQITAHTLTFRLAGRDHKVSSTQLSSWLTTQNGQLTLKTAPVTKYLTSLSKQYGTVFKNRRFKTTKNGTVTVPAGLYGWSINVASEVKQLKPVVLKQLATRNVTRTPTIQGSGYHKNGDDIGNTYVEVSKKNQHMWVYKNGKLVISTPVVTGKPVKGTTPSGVYVVWSKQRNATLRGLNDDGSKYASKVSYWMPVDDTGVGIHDSPWQPKYGGTWYKTHGSHGCVNTPPSVMKKVFSTVALQTPVIIY